MAYGARSDGIRSAKAFANRSWLLFEGLSGLSAIFGCLMSHEPVDLLIIMLGTNDTKERFSCNAENIAKGLERLTKKELSYYGSSFISL